MPDQDGNLTGQDVSEYTHGRLAANDSETTRKLRAALRAARNHCGWHVAPAKTETLTLDGPGTAKLSLPTLHIVELTSITENGVVVDVDAVDVSKRLGMVEKRSSGRWSHRYGSIVVAMTHGFTGDDAADFEEAVLLAVSQMSGSSVRDGSDVKRKKVDDVEYEWFEQAKQLLDLSLLAPYALMQSP